MERTKVNSETLRRFMLEMGKENLPIVFKGGMVLNLFMDNINPTNIIRKTVDIDGDWNEKIPSLEYMEMRLNKIAETMNPSWEVVAKRMYSENRSAGFSVIETKTNETIFTIDISVRQNPYSVLFEKEGTILHVTSKEKMMADKLRAISSKLIFRRAKDLVDLYILSHSTNLNINSVESIIKESGKGIGDFQEYLQKRDDLEHAYNKLKGVENKPDFHVLMERLDNFTRPFIERLSNLQWDGKEWSIIPKNDGNGQINNQVFSCENEIVCKMQSKQSDDANMVDTSINCNLSNLHDTTSNERLSSITDIQNTVEEWIDNGIGKKELMTIIKKCFKENTQSR